ncbi:MAG: hypothetical protein LBL96_01525 [Clostridiales bacterium]|jgi:alpha-tubulin suppressor-like RCC1 family protein|nr:hypothetical protein [Clostridiales bacterium]
MVKKIIAFVLSSIVAIILYNTLLCFVWAFNKPQSYAKNDAISENELVTDYAFVATAEPIDTLDTPVTNSIIFEVDDLVETRMGQTDISGYYITNKIADGGLNHYYIDESKVLWGMGYNYSGQLGQGYSCDSINEYVMIAENVVHVDVSLGGFMIYLTGENKLYGMGYASTGALLEADKESDVIKVDGGTYSIIAPKLLMEGVKYARCGKGDVVVIKMDGSVWTWGEQYDDHAYDGIAHALITQPTKILDGAKLITGGIWFHAALLEDGSVWTWGNNYWRNCGVDSFDVPYAIVNPTKVVDDAAMVWTESLQFNHTIEYDFAKYYEYPPSITMPQQGKMIIQKADGSLWVCGHGVGDQFPLMPTNEAGEAWGSSNPDDVCTSSFLPCEIIEREH